MHKPCPSCSISEVRIWYDPHHTLSIVSYAYPSNLYYTLGVRGKTSYLPYLVGSGLWRKSWKSLLYSYSTAELPKVGKEKKPETTLEASNLNWDFLCSVYKYCNGGYDSHSQWSIIKGLCCGFIFYYYYNIILVLWSSCKVVVYITILSTAAN